MEYLKELSILLPIIVLAVMSPGPDFAIITRNSLIHSRASGFWTAVGLSLGILVHVVYTLIGIGVIISQSIVLYSVIKYLGAAYLVYIGYKALKTKRAQEAAPEHITRSALSSVASLRIGFITNVTNPKVTIFFLSVFSQVISPITPIAIQALYGLVVATAVLIWFSLVTFIFSNNLLKKRVTRAQYYLEKAFGVLLIALGIKVAVSSTE